jgi:hypothetical protein
MTIEQSSNDAQQGKNNAEQGRNNAEQHGQAMAQGITNADQASTNADQATTNADQATTNFDQATTNSTVESKLTDLLNTSNTVQDVIIALTKSLQSNTESMNQVSLDLRGNLSMYEKVDTRIAEVELYAKNIEAYAKSLEALSDRRARSFKRLWKLAIVIAIIVSLGLSTAFYLVSAHASQQACDNRNISRNRVNTLIQQFYDIDLATPGANSQILEVEKNYLDSQQTEPVCGVLPWTN